MKGLVSTIAIRPHTEKFRAIASRLRVVKSMQQAQGGIHQPSAIEAWLDLDSALFWDERWLRRFRHPHMHLHNGTMNWPNRRPRHERYQDWYTLGTFREAGPLSDFQRLKRRVADFYDTARGLGFLAWMYRDLARQVPADIIQRVSDCPVGRPFHLLTPKGRWLTEPVLRHAYYVGQLAQSLPPSYWDGAAVLEIGAGYGSLARLLKRFFPHIRYVMTDLPERLVLQAYYLVHSFPGATFDIIDGTSNTGQPTADFTFVPTWRLADIPDRSIDIVVNTQSMQEMKLEQVDYYLAHVERMARGYF